MFGSDFLEEFAIQEEEGLAGERQYVPVAARSASHIPWKALGGDAIAAETEKRFDVFKKGYWLAPRSWLGWTTSPRPPGVGTVPLEKSPCVGSGDGA